LRVIADATDPDLVDAILESAHSAASPRGLPGRRSIKHQHSISISSGPEAPRRATCSPDPLPQEASRRDPRSGSKPETMPTFVKVYSVLAVLVILAACALGYLAGPELEVRAMSRLQARAVGAPFHSLTLPPEVGVLAHEGTSRWFGMRYPHDDRYGQNTNQRACWVAFLVDADGIVQRVDARSQASTRWGCVAAVEHYEGFMGQADPARVAEPDAQSSWVRIAPPEPDPEVDQVLAPVRAYTLRRNIRDLDLPSDLTMRTEAGVDGRTWHWVRDARARGASGDSCEIGLEVDAEGVVSDVQRRPAAEHTANCSHVGYRLVMAWHSDELWYVPGSPPPHQQPTLASTAGR
jgi:hypothetical protein